MAEAACHDARAARQWRDLAAPAFGQRIDFRLALGRERSEVAAIAFEERAGDGCLASSVAHPIRLEARNHRSHPTNDLTVDQIELMLSLATGLLHAEKLDGGLRQRGHGPAFRCQPMKSDGPS